MSESNVLGGRVGNNNKLAKIDRREGERENNAFWYIKETIERLINEAYRIRPNKTENDHLCGWLGWCEGEGCKERRV